MGRTKEQNFQTPKVECQVQIDEAIIYLDNHWEEPLGRVEPELEDQSRNRDNSDRLSNTRQTGSVKMKLEWLITLTITIIRLILMTRWATKDPWDHI